MIAADTNAQSAAERLLLRSRNRLSIARRITIAAVNAATQTMRAP